MGLGEVAAFVLVLTAVFLWGRLWFGLVEGLLARIRRLFGGAEPAPWHTLPSEEQPSDREEPGA